MTLIPSLRPGQLPPVPTATGSLVKWRHVAMLMLIAGGGIIELGLVAGWVTTDRPIVAHGAAAAFLLLAVAVTQVTVGSHKVFARVAIFTTIALITLLGSAFDGIVTVPVFYVWPLLAAAYLLTRTELVGFSVLAMVGCALGATAPELGIADYLSVLLVSVVVLIAVRALAENLGSTIKSLRRTSFTDPLTGLLNRRSLTYRMAQEFDTAVSTGKPLTALVLDIDHFKQINDHFGHATGDQALVRFSELLVSACRSTDLIARIGGEEFAIVMPGATVEHARERAARFAEVLGADTTIDRVRMTVSGGIATLEHGSDGWEALLTAADDAVYQAKRSGRDRVVVAGHRPRQHVAF